MQSVTPSVSTGSWGNTTYTVKVRIRKGIVLRR